MYHCVTIAGGTCYKIVAAGVVFEKVAACCFHFSYKRREKNKKGGEGIVSTASGGGYAAYWYFTKRLMFKPSQFSAYAPLLTQARRQRARSTWRFATIPATFFKDSGRPLPLAGAHRSLAGRLQTGADAATEKPTGISDSQHCRRRPRHAHRGPGRPVDAA